MLVRRYAAYRGLLLALLNHAWRNGDVKRILGWRSKSLAEAHAVETQQELSTRIDNINELLKYFSIGSRLQYYIEFNKNIQLDTIILSYRLDGVLLYKNGSIRLPKEEGNSDLLFVTEEGEQRISDLDSFRFVVPKCSRILIDYTNVDASIPGQNLTERLANDFRVGNTITLINKGIKGKMFSVDTTVAQVAMLNEGCYVNQNVACLQPLLETFAAPSTREFVRIYTNIQASLADSPGAEDHACTILDFSGKFLRAGLASGDNFGANILKGKSLFISITLPQSRTFLLQATVFSKRGDHVILSLDRVMKGHRFENLNMIDELELKANILQHPTTQQNF
jgi:hypothetical protein